MDELPACHKYFISIHDYCETCHTYPIEDKLRAEIRGLNKGVQRQEKMLQLSLTENRQLTKENKAWRAACPSLSVGKRFEYSYKEKISALETENKRLKEESEMRFKRMEWTVNDNAKNKIKLVDMTVQLERSEKLVEAQKSYCDTAERLNKAQAELLPFKKPCSFCESKIPHAHWYKDGSHTEHFAPEPGGGR